jgi:nucleotide-binding universal stress UspA family protein
LTDLVPPSAAQRGIRTETMVVEGDDPAAEISRAAAIAGADVVVAGTHGLSGFGHVLVGSTASAVVRSSPTPVVLVYPGRPDPSGRTLRLPPRSVLCPTDLSPRGNEAASVAYALAGPASTVHLLHAWQRPFCPSDDPEQERFESEAAARRGLMALARQEAQREIWTEVHAVEDDDPAAAIRRTADETHADLVVLSTHGLTDLRRVPMGPVAAETIRGHAPVVLVPHLGEDE